jgi:Fe-S-cluster containining protein
MYQKYKEFFKEYILLTNDIDKLSDKLTSLHIKHMHCKNGCDLCCIDFSIFPVEYYSILNNLKRENLNPETQKNQNNDTCVFLKNHSCTIYQHRPIMCRTHGFPLLYANDDGEYELSACELNFTEFDFEDFTMENTLPQDKYNSMLFVLNKKFIADFQQKKYGEMDLIPLKQLALEFITNKNHEL